MFGILWVAQVLHLVGSCRVSHRKRIPQKGCSAAVVLGGLGFTETHDSFDTSYIYIERELQPTKGSSCQAATPGPRPGGCTMWYLNQKLTGRDALAEDKLMLKLSEALWVKN